MFITNRIHILFFFYDFHEYINVYTWKVLIFVFDIFDTNFLVKNPNHRDNGKTSLNSKKTYFSQLYILIFVNR